MKLEHVNLTVADLDRSVAFYQDLLGWRTRWEGQGLMGRVAHVGDDETYLALFESAGSGPEAGSYDRVGFNHLGFVVDDLEDARARLRAAGREITSEQSYDPGTHLYFVDPDGYEVELVAYADDESPVPAA
jgi:catechol 2,3-dioxygenase-like lactoylglutathione lyase family enzyme